MIYVFELTWLLPKLACCNYDFLLFPLYTIQFTAFLMNSGYASSVGSSYKLYVAMILQEYHKKSWALITVPKMFRRWAPHFVCIWIMVGKAFVSIYIHRQLQHSTYYTYVLYIMYIIERAMLPCLRHCHHWLHRNLPYCHWCKFRHHDIIAVS